ncbi:MAG TPA: prephenate dehydrogenase/arogenate dehydrogenase family protein [Thermoanaerobaculia bacterium]|nr:prephenate dehydrogenase/arogenate dehydrogenase family protein [Thermoanaerobaculia bacterium]
MPSVTIAGLGLIGGSLGKALQSRGWSVAFVDPAVDAGEAWQAGAATVRLAGIGDAPSDLIVIATPVGCALTAIAASPLDVPITTTCSVMVPFALLQSSRRTVIAGHPFAGSEKSGLGAARADLFVGRPWFYDQDHEDPLVLKMIGDSGALPRAVSPVEHDRAVAMTSHLPQILSTALAAIVHRHPEVEPYVGEGLRTFLRLAASSPDIWIPVIEHNRAAINEAALEIQSVANAIIHDGDAEVFREAQELMARLQKG